MPRTLHDRALWLLCASSGCYVIAQIAVISFVVLYLHDERGWSDSEAAAVLAAIQVLAVASRIAVARGPTVCSRVGPLRLVGVAAAASIGLVALVTDAPIGLVVAAFLAAGVIGMSWNGLSFTAAAEIGGYAGAAPRSGAADGAVGRGPGRAGGVRRAGLVLGLAARLRGGRAVPARRLGAPRPARGAMIRR